MSCHRISVLKTVIDPFPISALNQYIGEAIASHKQRIIAHHNLHSVYLYHRDAKMRMFYERADIIHIDGMPLVYWARLLGYPVSRDQRVTYVDWIQPLLAMATAEGWRVFYLGGKPGVAARAAEIVCRQYPTLTIATHHGYFPPEENDTVLATIAAFQPHILLVGMGMPRQEHWVLDNLDKLTANAILTAGACFDYIAGAIPTPPRWMGRLGLEWLYRLISEPRRLGKRYLIEPWALLPLMIADVRSVLLRKGRS
ncbi:MAG TPA: glycosyltransferase [Chloroflexus aurantiacus]|uniref:Glycosyl transferase, WecB/TagA/CpsF family n=1 Tax=Chloroflexus aurantiacus (strain ATCC 29366 / DSM 635 / J-10-fl) TaxID=324602 RepID=A9WAU6_CHLAA|nr:WecB/TagA/CpsF family glycosyltransferase [Chloroflexus aurantiacus]ABY34727.1 glycosyl transferase, WecB/TagA/CpsF family [Chloroflexus aurantiacus J-10-fl]HBW67443.1 glycosyltransferase [Chloroflexus aurantiacus]